MSHQKGLHNNFAMRYTHFVILLESFELFTQCKVLNSNVINSLTVFVIPWDLLQHVIDHVFDIGVCVSFNYIYIYNLLNYSATRLRLGIL